MESVARALKTKEFARLRIGVSPATPKGKVKKPKGETQVVDFILGNFSKAQTGALKPVLKRASEAIQSIISDGLDRAMNQYN